MECFINVISYDSLEITITENRKWMIGIKLHATTCSVNLHNSKTIDLNLDHAYIALQN